MFSLLDPRLWLVCVFGSALIFGSGFLYGDHKRGHLDDLEKTAQIATANQEARKFEQLRQDNVNVASEKAASREKQLMADAATARRNASGLHNDSDALKRASEKSLAAALSSLSLSSDLLDRCTNKYLGVAEDAQRADTEARQLRDAWPK